MCGIYKIENLINGKIYIGKSIEIQKRLKSHITESFNENKPSYFHLIHKAIRKYGEENFSFDIIEECVEEDLNEREIYWISFYDCCILDGAGKGYNMTRGGDGSSSLNIYQIRELWDQGLSINEIAKKLNYDRHAVSKRIKEYNNFDWEEKELRKARLISLYRQKPINQYSLQGEFIQEYKSVSDASKQTNVGYRAICSNIQGKAYSAGGFIWTYKNEPPPQPYNVKGNGYKMPVVQLDIEYNFIKEFKTVTDASQAVGLTKPSSLYYALNDINKTIKGFHWIYKKDYDILHEADLAAH